MVIKKKLSCQNFCIAPRMLYNFFLNGSNDLNMKVL